MTSSHIKAEAMFTKLGFRPYRQFEPKTADAIGKGELFEVWESKSHRLVFVHFYGGNNGFEVYVPAVNSNLIAATEEALAAL